MSRTHLWPDLEHKSKRTLKIRECRLSPRTRSPTGDRQPFTRQASKYIERPICRIDGGHVGPCTHAPAKAAIKSVKAMPARSGVQRGQLSIEPAEWGPLGAISKPRWPAPKCGRSAIKPSLSVLMGPGSPWRWTRPLHQASAHAKGCWPLTRPWPASRKTGRLDVLKSIHAHRTWACVRSRSHACIMCILVNM